MNLLVFNQRLQEFDLMAAVHEAIVETTADIISLQQNQLGEGITGKEVPIKNLIRNSEEYSSWWGDYRASIGLQTDHFDLKVTGALWNSIKVDVNTSTYNIIFTDEKTADIEDLFGDVLGLTKANRGEYVRSFFKPKLLDIITAKLLV